MADSNLAEPRRRMIVQVVPDGVGFKRVQIKFCVGEEWVALSGWRFRDVETGRNFTATMLTYLGDDLASAQLETAHLRAELARAVEEAEESKAQLARVTAAARAITSEVDSFGIADPWATHAISVTTAHLRKLRAALGPDDPGRAGDNSAIEGNE